MTDLAAMTAAVRKNPTDAAGRLAYADMLDEHGRGVDAALQRVIAQPARDDLRLAYADAVDATPDRGRAEFVRAQVELANTPEPDYLTIAGEPGDVASYEWGVCTACRRTRPDRCRYHTLYRRTADLQMLPFTSERAVFGNETNVNERRWQFRRGFVFDVSMQYADWSSAAARLRFTTPLETVTLLDRPPVHVRTTDRSDDDVILLGGDWHPANLVAARAREFDGDWSRALLDLDYPGLVFELPRPWATVRLGLGGGMSAVECRGDVRPGDRLYADDNGRAVSERYLGPGNHGRPLLGVCLASEMPPGVRS